MPVITFDFIYFFTKDQDNNTMCVISKEALIWKNRNYLLISEDTFDERVCNDTKLVSGTLHYNDGIFKYIRSDTATDVSKENYRFLDFYTFFAVGKQSKFV